MAFNRPFYFYGREKTYTLKFNSRILSEKMKKKIGYELHFLSIWVKENKLKGSSLYWNCAKFLNGLLGFFLTFYL